MPSVLLIEDENLVAADLSDQLTTLGYDVVGVADRASEAIRLSDSLRPDLVVMDIQLRGAGDGIDAAREIRTRWRIPVVFLTAHASGETFVRAESVGPHGYLSKPFRIEDVKNALSLALRHQRETSKLFAENSWLRTMLDSLSDGVIATDRFGLVRYISPTAEKLTGWSADDAIGRRIDSIYRLHTPAGEPAGAAQLKKVLETGMPSPRSSFLLRRRDGKELHIEETVTPITGDGEAAIGAVALFCDITERCEAELERERFRIALLNSNEELSRFSYALAHDLQLPLRTAHTFAELLNRGYGGSLTEKQQQFTGTIMQATAGMQRLVESMLAFAQLGKGELILERLRPACVIQNALAKLATLLAESNATVDCGPLPEIRGDAVQLEQLFQNLLSNAMKYRLPDQPAKVTISARAIEDGWEFAITDAGQGIPPAALHKVFDPLQRLHGRDVPGTGLGLAICRKIVDRHGGEISAESPGPDLGATVRFTLRTAWRS